MKFVFDSFPTLESGEKNCWLLTNGLGGFASTSVGFSVTRADQGLLIAALTPSSIHTPFPVRAGSRGFPKKGGLQRLGRIFQTAGPI